ncbi:5,6-dimethylbenzimidazole synthase [Profundibacter amoris]|uniref:5,6-dimethylbenzimidazole synthase n=1 Tax=Profundibacter amoris TaxID=2171755 RepID=A0A347UKE8_9RHOB|nr:5,6-dimethylbenzimidazole synthase [Profundibacter amoris]AXX99326.1 5,6-dimethylbenzimidazole synthase [Profundibacter amoris]
MPDFSDQFRQEFTQLLRWRRDVRRFRTDPVEGAIVDRCLSTFNLAPSVGLSEPWRIVRVTSQPARDAAIANFEAANADALKGYSGEKAQIYSGLKLSGMRDAPVQFAVFCDDETPKGQGLGAATMPETRRYSVVAAITQFWLAARTEGLGVGWVSILDPARLTRDLDVPAGWSLIAYLCVGWPEENKTTPTLQQVGWETRSTTLDILER